MKPVIAFDIGGTSIRASIVEDGKRTRHYKVPTPKTKEDFLDRVDELIDRLNSSQIKSIGVATAGPIKDGVYKNPPNLPLKNFDFKKYLENKYKKKVVIGNDAGCFALAESKLGWKAKNFILLTFGTGIGGGIVIDSKVYNGTGYGAEFGHMYFGDKQWESMWKDSRNNIKKEYGENKLFRDLVCMKDKRSKMLLDEGADYIGKGIASLISAFDPDMVVIGGGIREAGKPFLDMIKKKVDKYSFLPKKTPIAWTKLTHPGTIGASLLVG